MPKKKKSPNSILATRADVEKARRAAKEEAADAAMAMMFSALIDKMGWDLDKIRELWNHIQSIDRDLREKRVTVSDLKDALKQETGIVFR